MCRWSGSSPAGVSGCGPGIYLFPNLRTLFIGLLSFAKAVCAEWGGRLFVLGAGGGSMCFNPHLVDALHSSLVSGLSFWVLVWPWTCSNSLQTCVSPPCIVYPRHPLYQFNCLSVIFRGEWGGAGTTLPDFLLCVAHTGRSQSSCPLVSMLGLQVCAHTCSFLKKQGLIVASGPLGGTAFLPQLPM